MCCVDDGLSGCGAARRVRCRHGPSSQRVGGCQGGGEQRPALRELHGRQPSGAVCQVQQPLHHGTEGEDEAPDHRRPVHRAQQLGRLPPVGESLIDRGHDKADVGLADDERDDRDNRQRGLGEDPRQEEPLGAVGPRGDERGDPDADKTGQRLLDRLPADQPEGDQQHAESECGKDGRGQAGGRVDHDEDDRRNPGVEDPAGAADRVGQQRGGHDTRRAVLPLAGGGGGVDVWCGLLLALRPTVGHADFAPSQISS